MCGKTQGFQKMTLFIKLFANVSVFRSSLGRVS